MRSISIKCIHIFTDGTLDFSPVCWKHKKQIIFYEKDKINSLFHQKLEKGNKFQNSLSVLYKSKYKV